MSLKWLDLPVTDPADLRQPSPATWNIVKVCWNSDSLNQRLLDYDGEPVLGVAYPKGSINPGAAKKRPGETPLGGIGFYGAPAVLPALEVTLEYQVLELSLRQHLLA